MIIINVNLGNACLYFPYIGQPAGIISIVTAQKPVYSGLVTQGYQRCC